MAYVVTSGILFVMTWFFTKSFSAYLWILEVFMLGIVYAIVGCIVWAIVRRNNRPVALGIFLGSITPVIATFAGTGGCMLVNF